MTNRAVNAGQIADAFDPETFHLILFPTEACNFRCVYCYEDFAIGRMRPAVVNGVKNLLDRRAPELRRLHISWFGGEPLLAKPIVFDIGHYAAVLADRFGFQLTADMTTNGSLLDAETMRILVDETATAEFQISLDGDAEHHDRTRADKHGKATFDRIWDNLVQLRRTPLEFSVVVRLHLTGENHASAARLVELFNREIGLDGRFSLYFKEVERLGGPNDAALSLLSGADRSRVRGDLGSRLLNRRQEFSLVAPGEAYICYASKPNSLAIRADGTVAKCTVALRDDGNAIGKLAEDGSLEISQDKFRNWLHGWQSLDVKSLSCPWASGMTENISTGGESVASRASDS